MSHQLMHCVDCKPGSPCWKHMGKTPYADNPTWEDYLPRDDEGNVVLDLTGAVQTGAAASRPSIRSSWKRCTCRAST